MLTREQTRAATKAEGDPELVAAMLDLRAAIVRDRR
jgi:hypothetical protein